jgi:uncharacterized protein (TIGR03435 family)
MKLNRTCSVAAVLSLVCTLQTHAATPAAGQPAPTLNFTQLYGAPDGTKTDWASLHGKVVVLEFWATWCAPCIAEIPHLNEFATSLAGNNVQFISVDDEDPAVVKDFIAKKHMEGWVGIGKSVFDNYGVQARPTTIVIDTQGHIAATMNPQQLVKDQLIALAAGKPVVFAPDPGAATMAAAQKTMQEQIAAMKNPAAGSAVKPLFEFSIRPGDANAMPMTFTGADKATGQSSIDMRNAPLSLLIPWATQLPEDRVSIHGDADKAHYNVHLNAPNLDLDQLAPLLQQAIAAAIGVKLTRHSEEEDAYVLQATAQADSKLTKTVSNHGSMCMYDAREGKLTMINTSLDDLAQSLEDALKIPVLNETKIPGEFDAGFSFPKDDFDATKAALETNLGLTLVKAKRTIERVSVDLAAVQPQSATAPAAVEKSMPVPGQSVQTIAVPRQP